MPHSLNKMKVISMNGQFDEVVLGVDPGFSVTGFSIIASKNGRVAVLECGFLKLSPQKTLSERVGIFHATMLEKITKHGVTMVALETSFLGKNAQTFLKLGFLRGVLYLIADQHKLAITEFAPREVKLAVTGTGGASKDQVAAMMLKLFPKLSDYGTIERADVTDALAVGLCGIWNQKSHLMLMRR